MLVVYGIVRAVAVRELDTSSLTEAAGGAIRLVAHRELAAIAADAGTDEILPSRANLLAHARVLDAIGTATVLPLRFGMAAPDEEALRSTYLEPEHDTLLASLDRLAGQVELRLQGRYHEETVLREVLASDRRARRLCGRGSFAARAELDERVRAGIAACREHDAATAVASLQPHVTGVVTSQVADPLDAFSISFLIVRSGLAAFDAAVDQLAETLAPRVRLELVGPLPPFSFVGGEA